ncbi:MAG: energy transducer TonB family protein [Chthoniobacterales bacterium]
MMEPKRDRRLVWWAVLASIAVHLLIGLSLAAFAGRQPDIALPEEQPPPQLTLMQAPEPTPPPLVPKHALTTTADADRKSAEAPKEKTFEANENSIAAAEKAATEDNQLPGQDGKERPFTNFEEHPNSFASAGSTPQPKPSPTAPPEKQPTPMPKETAPPAAPTPEPNQLALLTQTPTPIPSPPETEQNSQIPTPTATPTPTPEASQTPPSPASSYRDLQEKTIIRGGISNRGRSAVNAVGTPQGRYKKLLEDAIGSRWYYYTAAKVDLISLGTTSVTFEILADGSVQNLRMTENTGNEASASIALRSIQETKFPPIPDDLLATLPDGHFTMEESFTIFANQ